jgi:hypothetical protein
VLLLLLGAATTCAVAWSLAYWCDVGGSDRPTNQYCGAGACSWVVITSARPGVRQVLGISPRDMFSGSLSNERVISMLGHSALGDPPWPLTECSFNYSRGVQAVEKRCGWPWLALRGGAVATPNLKSGGVDIVDNRGCFARWRPDPLAGNGELVVIPLMPLWSGFVLNMLTFALAWAVVLAVIRAVRPRITTLSPRAVKPVIITCVTLGIVSTLIATLCCALFVDENARPGGAGDVQAMSYKGPHYRIWWLAQAQEPGASRWVSRWISGGEEIGPTGQPTTPQAEDHIPGWAEFLRPRAGTDLDWTQVIADARGWPWRAFGGGFEATRADDRVTSPQSIARSHFGIVVERRRDGDVDPYRTRFVPLRPLWPGLLADILVFTLAWLAAFVLLLGPGTLRRSLRQHRGQCLSCGYDLRSIASQRCPECGAERDKPLATSAEVASAP